MNNLKVMHLLNRKAQLREPKHYIAIIKILWRIVLFLQNMVSLLDLFVQVALLTIVHNNAQLTTLGFKNVVVTNYEFMLKYFEDLGLSQTAFFVTILHFWNIYFFKDHLLLRLRALGLYQMHVSEGTFSDCFQLFVFLMHSLTILWLICWIHYFLQKFIVTIILYSSIFYCCILH